MLAVKNERCIGYWSFICVIGHWKISLRFIWSTTVALEACVIFELEARQVKVESTSLRCTGPTTRELVTTSSSLTLWPRMRCGGPLVNWFDLIGESLVDSRSELRNGVSDWTVRPLESQWRLGFGRPAKPSNSDKSPLVRYSIGKKMAADPSLWPSREPVFLLNLLQNRVIKAESFVYDFEIILWKANLEILNQGLYFRSFAIGLVPCAQ